MRKFSKINEKLESGHMTWGYIIDSIENFIGCEKRDLEEWYDVEADVLFRNDQVKSLNNGYYINLNSTVFVFKLDSETPSAVIHVYEQHGVDQFKDMIIVYGHDNMILYDLLSGDHKNIHVR